MKKLSILLVLFSLVLSCGKDEKNSNEVVTSNPYTGGYVPPGTGYPGGAIPPNVIPGSGYLSFSTYRNRVQTGQFANLPSVGVEYSYSSYTSSTNSSGSWWIFDVYSYSGSSSVFYRSYEGPGQYYHELCGTSGFCTTISPILNSFATILNSATHYYPINQNRFMVLTSDNRVFEFDLSATVIANPISMRRTNGADQYFITGAYFY